MWLNQKVETFADLSTSDLKNENMQNNKNIDFKAVMK